MNIVDILLERQREKTKLYKSIYDYYDIMKYAECDIGDTVTVITPGAIYSTYDSFFIYYNVGSLRSSWAYEKRPEKNHKYTVIYINHHPDFYEDKEAEHDDTTFNKIMYCIRDDDLSSKTYGRCYLVDQDAFHESRYDDEDDYDY